MELGMTCMVKGSNLPLARVSTFVDISKEDEYEPSVS